jgi:hypothetical protein
LENEGAADMQEIEGGVGASGHFLGVVVGEGGEAQDGSGTGSGDDRPEET